jgi:spermidine/putrescine transport system substrate-binding protein
MQNGQPVQYRVPIEGSLAWIDGLSLSAAAQDLDSIDVFIDYYFAPESAGKSVDGGGDGDWGPWLQFYCAWC